MVNTDKLTKLYNEVSKHSGYQLLPEGLLPYINSHNFKMKSRYEKERLEFILSNVDVRDKSILDIGGNTGYFSFELLLRGAKDAIIFEGNGAHAEFVREASILMNVADKLQIENKYFDFFKNNKSFKKDVTLLLNVLHHIGDDFGNSVSFNEAKSQIIKCINNMAECTDILIFQIGFCWKGNRHLLLFPNGTKQEMIDFVEAGTRDVWCIKNIAVPEITDGKLIYTDLNKGNLSRNDEMGEFLNRPLFIMKAIESK